MHRVFRMRSLLIVLGVLVVATVLAAACGGNGSSSSSTSSSTAGAGQPKSGGTYNYPLQANPVYLDPLQGNYESSGTQVQYQIFQGLTTWDVGTNFQMKLVPNLAASWTSNKAATVFTFKLKKGITFQPPVNREVTAQDFVDEWSRVTDPANKSLTGSAVFAPVEGVGDDGYQTDPKKGLTGVKALDKYTLQVTLRYPYAEFPATLGHAAAAVAPVDYINKVGEKAFNLKPVGTGPYMVQKWVQNQYVDLAKNPNYWDKANAGYVDNIHMPVYTDTNTQWLAFQKGDLDYTAIPPGQVHSSAQNANVKSGKWTVHYWPFLATYFVGFTMTNPTVGYPAGSKGTDLRYALAYGANTPAIINVINEGVDVPATGFVPVGVPGYQASPALNPFTYSVAKAKSYVQKYGGTVPTLQYWFNTDLGHQKIAEALQAGWKQIGIDVKLSNFEWSTYLDKLIHGKQSGAEAWRLGWVADYPTQDDFLYTQFQSSSAAGLTGDTFYNNSQVDKDLLAARATLDPQAREAKYRAIEKEILADLPVIPLYFYRDYRITSTRVQGQNQDGLEFIKMWKVWVK